MSAEAQERWLQITAGKGPAECAWAVTQVIERLCREAAEHGVAARVVTLNAGPEPGTAESALLAVSGAKAEFINSWKGTVQWIAKSPFRPLHKRKNWFVGIDVWTPVEKVSFDPKDVKWETMRASGPGGQHVNRTESAVRITHLPTGIQATASEERSQHRNRKLALARLAQRIAELNKGKHKAVESKNWEAHQTLERGSPVRVFREGEQ